MVFNEFFTEMVLPFLLIFVVVFAILQKSKILGEGKQQIDAMVALIIGLLVIGLSASREFIVNFMPWLAVGLSVMLVFFILYGFVHGDMEKKGVPDGLKYTFGALAGIFTLGVVLYVTGLWETIEGWFIGTGEGLWLNTVVIILVIGAAAWVVFGGKGNGKKGEGS